MWRAANIVAVLSWTTAAFAEIHVDAPADCAREDRLRARVAELAGGAVPDADVVISRDGAVVRARILLRAPTAGERTFEGADCASVVEGAALVIAMSTRMNAREESPQSPAAPATPAPATPLAAPVSAQPVPATAASAAPAAKTLDRAPPIRLHAGVLGSVERGTLPATGFGFGLVVGARLAGLRLELEGNLYPGATTEVRPRVGGDFALGTALVRGCVDVARTSFELAPCVGFELDRLSASSFGASTSSGGQTALLFGPQLGALLAFAVTPWLAIRASVEAMVPLARQRFVIGNVGPVHRPAALAVRGHVGPEVRF